MAPLLELANHHNPAAGEVRVGYAFHCPRDERFERYLTKHKTGRFPNKKPR